MKVGGFTLQKQEFMDNVWSDFEFSYEEAGDYINSMDGIYYCGEANHDSVVFQPSGDALEHFIIDGKPLKDILADIDW